MTDTTPLTDQRLADIKADLDVANDRGPAGVDAWLRVADQHAAVLYAEACRLRAVEAAAYGFADEMAGYCSPHGVAADYAKRLRERLNQAGGAA